MKPHTGLSAGGGVRLTSSDHVILIPGISSRIWFASVLFILNSPTVFISMAKVKNTLVLLKRQGGRQRGRVVRAPDLKSGGHGFKSRSDH